MSFEEEVEKKARQRMQEKIFSEMWEILTPEDKRELAKKFIEEKIQTFSNFDVHDLMKDHINKADVKEMLDSMLKLRLQDVLKERIRLEPISSLIKDFTRQALREKIEENFQEEFRRAISQIFASIHTNLMKST